MINRIHVWSNISLNSSKYLRTTIEADRVHIFYFSRGDGLWCFWVPAWGSLWRRQCRILSVDSCSHLKNGYSSQHTAGFLFRKNIILKIKIMKNRCLFVLLVLLLIYMVSFLGLGNCEKYLWRGDSREPCIKFLACQ